MALYQSSEPADESSLRQLLKTVDNAISLQISLLGAISVITGFFVQFIELSWTSTGVWSAVMAVWGTALFLLGLTIYTFIWWSYQ